MLRLLLSAELLGWLACIYAQSPGPQYKLQVGAWSSCSTTCGAGTQMRVVSCLRTTDNETVQLPLCAAPNQQPASRQLCNLGTSCAGPPEVYMRSDGPCSHTCGGGYRVPVRACRRRTGRGGYEELPLRACGHITKDPKTVDRLIACNNGIPCREAHYSIGQWGGCSVSCGIGYKQRRLRCYQRRFGRMRRVTLALCRRQHGRVAHRNGCDAGACPGNYVWKEFEWSMCNVLCQQEREVKCYSQKDNSFVESSLCTDNPEPETFRRCVRQGNLIWQSSPWSKCSTDLGICAKQRNIACVEHFTRKPARSCPICLKPHEVEECAPYECHQRGASQTCDLQRDESEDSGPSECSSLRNLPASWASVLCQESQDTKVSCMCPCLSIQNEAASES